MASGRRAERAISSEDSGTQQSGHDTVPSANFPVGKPSSTPPQSQPGTTRVTAAPPPSQQAPRAHPGWHKSSGRGHYPARGLCTEEKTILEAQVQCQPVAKIR